MDTQPDPSGEDWIDFLRWLEDNSYSASQVIDMVEKPHNYADEYAEYQAAGGLER